MISLLKLHSYMVVVCEYSRTLMSSPLKFWFCNADNTIATPIFPITPATPTAPITVDFGVPVDELKIVKVTSENADNTLATIIGSCKEHADGART